MHRNIWRFVRPVLIKGAQKLLTADSQVIKSSATENEIISLTLQQTLSAVFGAAVDIVQIALQFTSNGRAPTWIYN